MKIRKDKSSIHNGEYPYVKYLFILPSFIMFSFALLYPFLSGIKIAFTNWDGLKTIYEFNGLDNFARMFGDRRLGNALKNTLIYAGMGVVMNNVLTLGLAVLFNDFEKALGKYLQVSCFYPVLPQYCFISVCLEIYLSLCTEKFDRLEQSSRF